MAIPPSAAPGSVPPTEAPAAPPKKRKPLTPEQMQRRALRQQQKRQMAEDAQADWDRRAAQEFHQITDGSSQTISKRGVRQRGVSDPEAAAMVRQRLGSGPADNRPSTAAVSLNPNATVGAGRGRRLSETMVDPYKPSGFQSTGMDGKPGFQLRTEAERQARISESPLTVRPKLISSKSDGRGEVINSRDGDFNAEESRMYADRARRGGFGSAKPAPGSVQARQSPNVPTMLTRPTAMPSTNSPAAIVSGAEAGMKRPVMTPQPGPVAPAMPGSTNSPAAIIQGAEGAMRGKPLANVTTPTPNPSPTPSPAASPRPPVYGEPGFRTAAQFATGWTPQLEAQRKANDTEFSNLRTEANQIRNPWGSAMKQNVAKVEANLQQGRSLRNQAAKFAPMQNEQTAMTAQGMSGPPKAAAPKVAPMGNTTSPTSPAIASGRRAKWEPMYVIPKPSGFAAARG